MDYAYQGKHPFAKLAAMAIASNACFTQDQPWLVNNAATDHMTASLNQLSFPKPYTTQDNLTIGNGQTLPITHIGTSLIPSSSSSLQLHNVLRVPSIASNLASVQKLCHDNNCQCYFYKDILSIQALNTRKILYQGRSEGGVYPIYPYQASQLFLSPKACNNTSRSSVFNKTLWHMRLDHPNDQAFHCLFPSVNFVHTNNVEDHTCTHCLYGKMHNLSFPHSDFKASSPFELVHYELWGLAPVVFVNGYKYYILLLIITLDLVGFIYLSPNLKPLLNLFIQFLLQIKTFKSDGGGKFTSNEFKAYLSNHGIAHHISCPYTPQQNGVVEMKHRHIIETAIALLSQASLSYSFWTFAVQTAISLINVLSTSVLAWQSPWSILYSTSSDMSQFNVFGCTCYPNLRPYTTHKLEPRTRECIFIGYPTPSKGYLWLDPHTKYVYTSRHVVFNESKFPGLPYVQLVSFTSSNSTIPTWLSNQLFLHSTNQPSLLGSCPSPSPNPPFHSVIARTPTPAPTTPMPSPNSSTLSSQFSVRWRWTHILCKPGPRVRFPNLTPNYGHY